MGKYKNVAARKECPMNQNMDKCTISQFQPDLDSLIGDLTKRFGFASKSQAYRYTVSLLIDEPELIDPEECYDLPQFHSSNLDDGSKEWITQLSESIHVYLFLKFKYDAVRLKVTVEQMSASFLDIITLRRPIVEKYGFADDEIEWRYEFNLGIYKLAIAKLEEDGFIKVADKIGGFKGVRIALTSKGIRFISHIVANGFRRLRAPRGVNLGLPDIEQI